MISFPNAKINIGLNITGKREDGYHYLETMFFPIPLCDCVEIIEDQNIDNKNNSPITFSQTGIEIDGELKNNLCVKAFNVLNKDFDLKPIKMHLHKNIPFGAGIGGGSADAAFVLNMLNDMFELQLSKEQLKIYATKVGADCAFFIDNTPSVATGIGEILTPIELNLKNYHLLLLKPDIHISTAEAYKHVTIEVPKTPLKELVSMDIKEWKHKIKNDFEESVFPQYPELKQIKDTLYTNNAVYASLTGSGAALYGIFESEPEQSFIDKLKMNYKDCYIWQCVL